MTAKELLDRRLYFVICTYQFVQSLWRAWRRNWKFYGIVQKLDLEETLKRLRSSEQQRTKKRHVNCLFSQVYRLLSLPIKHLVLDEAQAAKNPESITHEAIRHLYYDAIFLVSGTFISNIWYGIYGFVSLLPGHPFKEREDFTRVFGRRKPGQIYLDPSPSKRNRLVKFLQAFVVSRPATLLQLEEIERATCSFRLSDRDANMAAYHAERFLKAMLQSLKTK